MITQIDFDGDDDLLEPGDAHVVDDDSENQEAQGSSEQLHIAVKTDITPDDTSNAEEEDDEFAEEDAWLLACRFLEDNDERERDPERYVPQLMDAREMRQLRATLRKSEAQIQTCGRMREFTPCKPVASPKSHARRRNSNLAAQRHDGKGRCSANNNNNSSGGFDAGNAVQHRQQQGDAPLTLSPTRVFLTAVPPTAALLSPRASQQKEGFALVLRRELQQVRELEARYEETKRMLLEQMDVICSLKPSERTGGPETYETLAELMAYVRLCQAPIVPES
ncbi:hypothetical protein Gpo141_00009510 [Globisporangium polare]